MSKKNNKILKCFKLRQKIKNKTLKVIRNNQNIFGLNRLSEKPLITFVYI